MSENYPSWAAPLVGFKSRKAAQICAHFAVLNGGHIEKLKLIKLVYLTEREFLHDHHLPMLFDELYSLPNGPICSSTLNGIDGIIHDEIWSDFIARNGNIVVAVRSLARDDLDELSDAEISAIQDTWNSFGRMTASQLVTYTHNNCPEYTEVERGSRLQISYADVLRALGDPDDEAIAVEKEIKNLRRAESILS